MLLAGVQNGTQWVVKFCVDHYGRSAEAGERELLISMLGRAAGVAVVDAWVIPAARLVDHVRPLSTDPLARVIEDKAVLMPLIGGPTADEDKPVAAAVVRRDPPAVGDLFAFMHWVGDEDRGLWDVMVDGPRLLLIDNGLCGPGTDPRVRGYHPAPDYTPDRITLKCYGYKPSLVEFVLRESGVHPSQFADPPVLERIEALSDDAIAVFVRSAGLAEWVTDRLKERKRSLRAEYISWLGSAIAICSRPIGPGPVT